MLQSRALLIALILLFSTTVPEVHSKAMIEKERRDWMVIPDAVAAYIHGAVNKVFPRIAQLLADIAQTQPVVVTRNFLVKETAKLVMLFDQLVEKLQNVWYTRVLGY